VIRLLISMLCALGMALSPVAAGASGAASSGMLGCTMGCKMPNKSADHSTRNCCTPACQALSSAALIPDGDVTAPAAVLDSTKLTRAPEKELASVANSGLDPPPRT